MRFDIADLDLFLAVADAGSITAGATAANLSLAAASERLARMEAAAGVALLSRGRRGVSPTPDGETLAHHARLILRQVGAMRADLAGRAKGFRGSVRVLAHSAAVAELLPTRLGPFLVAHPNIDVDLAERPSPDIVKAVAGGLAEIGIVSDAADPGALLTRPFAVDHLVVVCSRDHPLAAERRVALARIVDERAIAFDGPMQRQVDEEAGRLGGRRHHLRGGVSARGVRCRPGHRSGDSRAPLPKGDVDRNRAADGPLGDTPAAALSYRGPGAGRSGAAASRSLERRRRGDVLSRQALMSTTPASPSSVP